MGYFYLIFPNIQHFWIFSFKINKENKIGKLPIQSLFEEIEPQLIAGGITVLLITFTDTVQFRYLPLYHRDQFDRILVAQAINNSLVLISRNPAFDAYSIQRVWLWRSWKLPFLANIGILQPGEIISKYFNWDFLANLLALQN